MVEEKRSLESGFVGETEVLLRDGSRKFIKEIVVGDYLTNGEKVLGIVRILADDVVVKKYNIKVLSKEEAEALRNRNKSKDNELK